MPIPSDYEMTKLREAVRLRPFEVAQQIWLLAALAWKEDLEASAEKAFRKMYELKPTWTQLHYDVVAYWVDRGANASTLLRVFEKARQRTPGDMIALYAFGLVLQATALQERAIEVYQEAIKLKPNLAVVHHNLGVAYNLFGRRDEAAEACLKASKLDPTMAEPHFLLGSHYGLKKMRKEAIFHCQKFLDLAYPYLEQYIPTAELSIAIYKEAEGEGSFRRFWNHVRRRR